MKYLLFVLTVLVTSRLSAAEVDGEARETQPVDTTSSYFRPTQLILPGALIAAGCFGSTNNAFQRFNRYIRQHTRSWRGEGNFIKVDDYLQYLPVAAYVTMGACGVRSRHDMRERLAAGATAYAAMGIFVNTMKYTIRNPRPGYGRHNSFPSGHTATAFMGAELIRQEYGTGIAVGVYTVATGIAFLRIYNDRHWFNDVIAGAGVGILSARIGYWLLPFYRKWFHWTPTTAIALAPTYNHSAHTLAMSLIATF